MLKKLGLLLPPLRRLHDDRNKYAALVQTLENGGSALRPKNAIIQSEDEKLKKISLMELTEMHLDLKEILLTLKGRVDEIGNRQLKIDENLHFRIDDIRREHLSRFQFNDKVQGQYKIDTEFPIALKSDDHIYPRGTQNDNTRCPRFVYAAERALGKPLKILELGCAGGGLVLDFLIAGHEAIGIEGSDYSSIWRRAEWANIPDHLFTADITKPFTLTANGMQQKFDLITAWEVLEHIRDEDLDGLFSNIRQSLSPKGLFCGSVAMFEDRDPVSGAVWHVTVKPYDWWQKRISDAGFEIIEGLFSTADFPRGSGNPRAIWDWDANASPEMGFHICFRNKN
jgi:SAM-dependent methyltransferase